MLHSIINQDFEDFEVIVVNDGSTDGGPQIVRELAAKDSRIHLFSQANRGVSSARNHGLAEARGDFVWFVDGDDEIHPDSLRIVHEALALDEKVDAIAILHVGIAEKAQGVWPQDVKLQRSEAIHCSNVQEFVPFYVKSLSCSVYDYIFRRERILNIPFRPYIRYEDLMWRDEALSSADLRICVDTESILYHYVQHAASCMHQVSSLEITLNRLNALVEWVSIPPALRTCFVADIRDRMLLAMINDNFIKDLLALDGSGWKMGIGKWREVNRAFFRCHSSPILRRLRFRLFDMFPFRWSFRVLYYYPVQLVQLIRGLRL